MTDLKRHSLGYWRSIYIFEEIGKQYRIGETLIPKLEEMNLIYSYCYYGEVPSSIPALQEKAHITFRINFPDMKAIETLSRFLNTQKWTWEEHNYDEPLWVKEAYVIGTLLANEIKKAIKNPDVPLNANFYRLLLHGCLNNLHYNKKQEVELYYFLFNGMLSHVTGIAIPNGENRES